MKMTYRITETKYAGMYAEVHLSTEHMTLTTFLSSNAQCSMYPSDPEALRAVGEQFLRAADDLQRAKSCCTETAGAE